MWEPGSSWDQGGSAHMLKRPFPAGPDGFGDSGLGPPPSSVPKTDFDDEFSYGGPYQTGISQMKSDSSTDAFRSSGLPSSFVCSGNGQDDFAEDIPLDRNQFKKRGQQRYGGGGGNYGQQPASQYSRGEYDSMDYDSYSYYYGGGYDNDYNSYGEDYGGFSSRNGGGFRGGKNRGGGGRGQRGQGRGQERGGGAGRGFGRGGQMRGDRGRGNRGARGGNMMRGGMQRGAVRGGGSSNQIPGPAKKKPGLAPQAAFVGQRGGKNKRGIRGSGVMAPVHSLSRVGTQPFDVSNMSTAEKIHRFALYVQGEPLKINAIQTIENGLTGSKLNLKTNYEVEELMRVSGKWMFTGRLLIGETFLARAVGANKKEVKHETYQKALDILKTKTVAEIFALVDPGADAIRKELSSTLDTNKDVEKQAENILEKQVSKAAQILTSHDGFQCLVNFITENTSLPDNRISAVEQAMAGSKCGLTHSYDFKASRLPSGRFFFHGILTVGDIIVAIGKGFKKKDAKVDTYEKAFENLTSKPLEDLLKGLEIEEEALPESKGGDRALPPEIKRLSLAEKMEKLIQTLKDSVYRDNNINTIDVAASGLGLVKTCIYRRLDNSENSEDGVKSNIICDFYLDNVLISSGEGERRKEAQIEAYNSAWDTLSQTSGERVAKDHKRLTPADSSDPTVIDIFVKGQGKPNGDSNLSGLKRNNHDYTNPDKTVESIVIIEHEDWTLDRKRQAFCILNHSATQNGMLLKWQTEAVDNMFKCSIKLQNQDVGEATAYSKNNARNLAAGDALFRLYETQDVIKVVRKDDSCLWIPYENIVKKAESLRVESGEEAPAEAEVTEVDGKLPSKSVNKWIIQVADSILKEYKDQSTLDELIFGPGIPLPESKEIRTLARGYDLKHDMRQLNGKPYTVMHVKMSPQDMAKCLKEQGGESGKYLLVDRSLLPSHEDIEKEIKKQSSMQGPYKGFKSTFKSSPKKEGFQPKFLND